ncbi:MAG: hypothetical protein U9O41_00505 [Candidatus Aerophobetes bacterium]|nr:hypothetical protein [Candidatus Aerophobetes bacterium]
MKSKPRLGRKDIFIENKVTRKPEKKMAVKPEKNKTRKTDNQKRIKVTFQIPEALFIQIKIKAAKEQKKISELVKEIFVKYLSK